MKIVLLGLLAFLIVGCQCNRRTEKATEEASEQDICTTISPAKLGGLISTDLEAKYMIVVAAYRQREYAEHKVQDMEQKGNPAFIVDFRNGLLAVVICPSDDLDATIKKLEELRVTEVCPQDAWILTNEYSIIQ